MTQDPSHSHASSPSSSAQGTSPSAEPPDEPAGILSDQRRSQLALIGALCLIGANLRPMISGLGPVLESVSQALSLGSTATGLLITLPVLCFGLFAPFVPRLLQYQTAERLIFLGMILQAAGIGLRSLFGVGGLFLGTFIGGASISVVMVLLPSLIKHHFPTRASTMMGLYSAVLCLGAGISAAFVVPIEQIPGSNWQWALGFWLIPALISAFVWLPYTRHSTKAIIRNPAKSTPRLLKSALAWQVTLFMGSQSAVAYCVFGWMPIILIERGMSSLAAGFILSLCMIVQIPSSLIAPWLSARGKDQRSTILLFLSGNCLGLAGLFYAPIEWAWYSATILALGLGGMFSLALSLLVLRAPNTAVAAALSGMAQGVGYTVAAAGPIIVGLLHDYFGNWHAPAAFFGVLLFLSLVFGMGAGRSLYIKAG